MLIAQENNGSSWKQTFLYDRFGNRTIDPANTTLSLVGPNPSINPLTNRIATGQGYSYDAAGNLTADARGHTYGYNADNLQVSYDGTSASYFYDGSNKRVKTLTDGGTKITVFVYDAMGKLVAEYTNTAPTGSGTSYLTQDILGSPRVVTGANQAVITRRDFQPYGGEIGAGLGGRTTGQGYVTDNVRQKFTGQQRDTESGLDYFNSRYYSSVLGRFTSADSFSGRAVNPQSLNLYAYTQNNPLTMIDPMGHDPSAVDDVDYYGDKEQEAWHNNADSWGMAAMEAEYERRLQDNSQEEAVEDEASDPSEPQQPKPLEGRRYLLVVGDPGIGEHNAGTNFDRAANTKQQELEQQGAEVIVGRASTVSDLNNLLTSNGQLDGVEFFGHATYNALYIGETSDPGTNLDSSNVSQLSNVNLKSGAYVSIHACFAGSGGPASIASRIAHQLGRTTYAYDGGLSFSPNPHRSDGRKYPPRTGPIYMAPDRGVRLVVYTPRR